MWNRTIQPEGEMNGDRCSHPRFAACERAPLIKPRTVASIRCVEMIASRRAQVSRSFVCPKTSPIRGDDRLTLAFINASSPINSRFSGVHGALGCPRGYTLEAPEILLDVPIRRNGARNRACVGDARPGASLRAG